MKRILTSFTFYFVLLSIFTIYMHYVGYDSKNIMLIHLNLILSQLQYTDFAKNVLNSGPLVNCKTISGSISVYWYIAQFITFIFYGIICDFFKLVIKKLTRQ
jgi:hypothetical protein